MLLKAAVASCALVTTVTGAVIPTAAPAPTGVLVIDSRELYLQHAKSNGMCRSKPFRWDENLDRRLVAPGPKILAPFKDCVAKNDFGETVQDGSGDIFCQGLVSSIGKRRVEVFTICCTLGDPLDV
jgi:hypothetical protein